MKTKARSVRTAPGHLFGGNGFSVRPASGKSRTSARPAAAATAPAAAESAQSRRKFYVFLGLVGLLSGTSGLLLALAPAPLSPGSAGSLFAIDQPRSMDVIFNTNVAVADGRWKYIYVHHSQTPTGNASTLGGRPGGLPDHFVIGNGAGGVDGEVQIGHRWTAQLPAGQIPGTQGVDPACVSICLVGDFDRTPPTAMQRMRLTQLVRALQTRLGIGSDRVWFVQGTGQPADAGRHFPVDDFRRQLNP